MARLSANAEVGSFYDGSLVSGSLTPTWNASRHVELSGAWQVNRITFPDRDQGRVTHVGRLRTVLMLNTQLSGVALLQVNSATDALLVNLRLRYHPREGNDLYVVYNHGLNTDRFGYELRTAAFDAGHHRDKPHGNLSPFMASDEVARAMEEDWLRVETVRVLSEISP